MSKIIVVAGRYLNISLFTGYMMGNLPKDRTDLVSKEHVCEGKKTNNSSNYIKDVYINKDLHHFQCCAKFRKQCYKEWLCCQLIFL